MCPVAFFFLSCWLARFRQEIISGKGGDSLSLAKVSGSHARGQAVPVMAYSDYPLTDRVPPGWKNWFSTPCPLCLRTLSTLMAMLARPCFQTRPSTTYIVYLNATMPPSAHHHWLKVSCRSNCAGPVKPSHAPTFLCAISTRR
jgi:hypothetical protein